MPRNNTCFGLVYAMRFITAFCTTPAAGNRAFLVSIYSRAVFNSGQNSFSTLTQSIPTVAGQTYNISFFFSPSATIVGVPNEFRSSFGTTQGVDVLNTQGFPYQQFSFQAKANGPATTLTFTSFQNGALFALDDLSVTAASPVPKASTTVSFGLLLALGLGGMVVAAKRKKIAP